MIRFPNPGSNMGAFVRTFQVLSRALCGLGKFSLDDMSAALVETNLATSSGHIGKEALKRSTRSDRTRDPLFNQSKMYSELFRVMGWIQPTPSSMQTFMISYLGSHVMSAEEEPTGLVKECLLGIAYPNPLVEIKGSSFARPMAFILLTAASLEGRITRDEMIIGPMDISDDRDQKAVASMIGKLAALRAEQGSVSAVLKDRASRLGVQVNTLHNYTRFPLGVLRWAGWTRPERDSGIFDVLTTEGARVAASIKDSYDVRAKDLSSYPPAEVDGFLRVATYRMLGRSGYSLIGLTEPIETMEAKCKRVLDGLGIRDTKRTLFSPFQECDPQRINPLFPPVDRPGAHDTKGVTVVAFPGGSKPGRPIIEGIQPVVWQPAHPKPGIGHTGITADIVRYVETDGLGLDQMVDAVMKDYGASEQNVFYPAVADLFRFLGHDCICSRAGVNYQRMDALIRHATESIPIEIKSPAEQQFISVKGVRQALENKVVLLSRKYVPTLPSTTSLVVGYELPNDRSEVANLIEDIFYTYQIAIGVFGFRSLVELAGVLLLHQQKPKDEDFRSMRGIFLINGS